MKIVKIMFVSTLLLQFSWLQAAVVNRNATIESAQMESATRTGYENIMYIKQSGAWSGSTTCQTNWAYFNAQENKNFVALTLSARITKAPVVVYIDDSLPRLDGFCQIINLQF